MAGVPTTRARPPRSGQLIELRPIGPEPFTPPAAKAFLALAITRAEDGPAVRLVA